MRCVGRIMTKKRWNRDACRCTVTDCARACTCWGQIIVLRGDDYLLGSYILPFDTRSDGGKSLRSGGQIRLHALQCINRRTCTMGRSNIDQKRNNIFDLHTFNNVQHRIA